MIRRAKSILRKNDFDAIYDKGYYNAEEINKCHTLGIETHVAIPNPSSTAPDYNFNLSQMVYHKTNDTYTCPSNQTLKSNGRWYNKGVYRVKQYKTPHCKNCELRAKCTTSKSARIVERHEFSHALDRNRTVIKNNPNIYSQRQSLVDILLEL